MRGALTGGSQLRALAAASLLALGIGACGSSARRVPNPDQARLGQIDRLLSELTRLEGTINADPVAGSRRRKHASYVRTEQPLIDQFHRTALQLRHEVASLHDAQPAMLYSPLVEAVGQEAHDLERFLSFVIARDAAGVRAVATRLGPDERRINQVALEQFPKVRAYVVRVGG